MRTSLSLGFVALSLVVGSLPLRAQQADPFSKKVAPILEQHCLRCHNDRLRRGGLSLASEAGAKKGGVTGPVLVAGKPEASFLLKQVRGPKPQMPRGAAPLSPDQIAVLETWIAGGAKWPEGIVLTNPKGEDLWWSLRPLTRPPVPPGTGHGVIDRFLDARLAAEGLVPVAEADRRTLIRRLTFDLLGLPPRREDIEAFERDPAPDAYERLVDRFLASPHYGERWGRHWLDVVHYGDTHGFDKDKVRPNSWPYRDYVIRAFNEDRPYRRLIEEQIAGDALYPGTRDGITGLGFLAAGPWDFVGQVELREGTLDKAITRNLDRDDMVATVMNTFVSMTVQCARCHDHKFDPISQEDYYSLQAVFAAIDRAERPYEPDATAGPRRLALRATLEEIQRRTVDLEARLRARGGEELAKIDATLATLATGSGKEERPEFGYHSAIASQRETIKWVQVDLGTRVSLATLVLAGCHDPFNGIGAGFGFPTRYKVDISDDEDFRTSQTVYDATGMDVPNPGVVPQFVRVGGREARFVRITATRLAPRMNDYIFALGEVLALTPEGRNVALGKKVTALDSIEAPVRWSKKNLVDGYAYGLRDPANLAEGKRLQERRQVLLRAAEDDETRKERQTLEKLRAQATAELAGLPPPGMVYAAATSFPSSGNFVATRGLPRPIHLLQRGSEKNPRQEVGPGTLACISGLPARFSVSPGQPEEARRTALARWITDPNNPLTWRSIVNRVWHYHFGRGLVDSPNDFGRMGALPSHPELLDWLAVDFRDGNQSLKDLHRRIVTSTAYRRSSAHQEANANRDSSNRNLWRMNRRRLESESLRDAVLTVTGRLDPRMGGPGFRPFGFKDDHSPHYNYEEYDPDEPSGRRRSIYRFLVRSVPDPFMETLDCADPSLAVEKRHETLTALQALALLNNRFMVRMASHFATRVDHGNTEASLEEAFHLALGRAPVAEERAVLLPLAHKHGLANVCRLILNMNEFCFVD